jgi:predicted nucleic acid-binding protein
MKKEPTFVDTSFWIAFLNARESRNHLAVSCLRQAVRCCKLYISDFVVFETLTYLNCTLKRHDYAVVFYKKLNMLAQNMLYVNDIDRKESLRVFFTYSDARFSMTDCSSFVLMQRLGIRAFLGFDNHFCMMGFKDVVAEFSRI